MIIPDMSEREYHGRQELSSTGARRLLESPAKFRYFQDNPQPHSDAFDVGSAVHAKVLGVGWGIEEMDFPDWRTKAARDARDAAREAGLIPMLSKDLEPVYAMVEAVLANQDARSILEGVAGREVTIITDVDGVPTRARFDIYDGVDAADLKTARDASPKGFNTSVGRYGYHVQERWYRDAHTAETGIDLQSFKFIVVENTAPYLVGVYDLDFMWDDIGRKRAQQARDLYRRCVETDTWPGYGTTTLTPPTWAVFEHEEEEITV